MSYKYSKGAQVIGDLSGSDDADRNTGIDWEEDYIGFETGGSTHMVVSGSKVGIGTTTPDYMLDVAGDMGIDQKIYHNGDADTYINFTDNRIRFDAGGLNLFGMHKKSSAPHQVTVNNGGNNVDFVINDNNSDVYFRADASTGRIGIGTDSPETELHISAADGRVRAEATSGNHPGYEWAIAGTRKWIVYNDPDNSDNLAFKTNSNVRMSIEQDGNVGIATQSPIAKLDVAGKIAITSEVSTPTAPADGKGWLYTKSDGKIYWQSADVAETDLTSGSGGGGSTSLGSWYLSATDSNADLSPGGGLYVIVWDTEEFNTFTGSSPMNTSTGIFTAPSSGYYWFHIQASLADDIDSGATRYQLVMHHTPSGGSEVTAGLHRHSTKGGSEEDVYLQITRIINLNTNDTIKVGLFQFGGGDITDVVGGEIFRTSFQVRTLD